MSPYIPLRDTREQPGKGYFHDAPKMTLSFGDYALGESFEDEVIPRLDLAVVERKASGSEIANNLGKHRARFVREIEKMRETKHKFLVIEDSLENVLNPAFSGLNRNFILCSIIDLCLEHNLIPIFAGNALLGEEFTQTLFERIIKKEKSPSELGGTQGLNMKHVQPQTKGVHDERKY